MTVFTGLILVILSFWLGYQCSLYILSQRIIANPQILVDIVEKLDKQLEEKEIKKLKEAKNRQNRPVKKYD